MKWFNTQTDADRSHERIMAILDAIDPAELFGQATPSQGLAATQSATAGESRE